MISAHATILGDFLASLFLLAGLFFMVVGVVGMHRFPDPYGKLHATTKCVTLGMLGFLLAAIFHLWVLPIITKAVMTIAFVFIANPVGSHMIAKAAHKAGYRIWDKTLSDELEEDRQSGVLDYNPSDHDGYINKSGQPDAENGDDSPGEEEQLVINRAV
ncbi:MAG TPA: monovalent cation/H(+) antiporter subunit G [Phycisphaeraceae bacterium]|nr:monovalent cation/H(+) antiporter subunit G [Phycisphaeraceae bacterium]